MPQILVTNQKPSIDAPRLGEPYLLTPGPLTTAFSVKEAMLRDWGSWDGDFRAMTAQLRTELLEMIGDSDQQFDCVPIQGSGTFVVEAMLAVLGEALADGRTLNLQPLGKVKINRMKQVAKDRVIICKIRQSGRAKADIKNPLKTPLAGAAE